MKLVFLFLLLVSCNKVEHVCLPPEASYEENCGFLCSEPCPRLFRDDGSYCGIEGMLFKNRDLVYCHCTNTSTIFLISKDCRKAE
jgi:hypothetical protein